MNQPALASEAVIDEAPNQAPAIGVSKLWRQLCSSVEKAQHAAWRERRSHARVHGHASRAVGF